VLLWHSASEMGPVDSFYAAA